MKKMMIWSVALLVVAAAGIANGAALDRKIVSANANWVLHADLEGMRASKVGGALFDLLQAGPMRKAQREIKNNLGMDIDFAKIQSITAYGSNFEEEDNDGVLIIRAGQNMKPALNTLAESENDEVKVTRSKQSGLELFGLNGEMYVTQLPGNLLVASRNAENIVNANSVMNGKKPNLAGKNGFADYPKTKKPIIFLQAKEFNKQERIPPNAQFLKKSEGMQLALGESEKRIQLDVTLKTSNKETSTEVSQVVNGMLALVRLNQDDPDLTLLLESAEVKTSDRMVSLNLSFPIDIALEKMENR